MIIDSKPLGLTGGVVFIPLTSITSEKLRAKVLKRGRKTRGRPGWLRLTWKQYRRLGE